MAGVFARFMLGLIELETIVEHYSSDLLLPTSEVLTTQRFFLCHMFTFILPLGIFVSKNPPYLELLSDERFR